MSRLGLFLTPGTLEWSLKGTDGTTQSGRHLLAKDPLSKLINQIRALRSAEPLSQVIWSADLDESIIKKRWGSTVNLLTPPVLEHPHLLFQPKTQRAVKELCGNSFVLDWSASVTALKERLFELLETHGTHGSQEAAWVALVPKSELTEELIELMDSLQHKLNGKFRYSAAESSEAVLRSILAAYCFDYKKDWIKSFSEIWSTGDSAELKWNEPKSFYEVHPMKAYHSLLTSKQSGSYLGLERFIPVPFVLEDSLLERWLSEKNGPSQWRLLLQPTQEIRAGEFFFVESTEESLGLEPGPMAFGKSHIPTVIDVLLYLADSKLDIFDNFDADNSQRIENFFSTFERRIANTAGKDLNFKSLLREELERDFQPSAVSSIKQMFGPFASLLKTAIDLPQTSEDLFLSELLLRSSESIDSRGIYFAGEPNEF
ncbi:MAG: hypothetical protein COT74_01340 [Bdellovibrionales bacterium CG10_big_fil_rev_8_21_14_0_10_45_34]|nr:MAG: hypothetical protein COT74_01340 [Bdellovibrionales bacterium CG10_big_fil_rev_8_21_14_0_10_45_34]